MKLIVAVVRPFKVTEIVDAVEGDGAFPGMTVLECRGFGREKGQPHQHAREEDLTDFVDRRVVLVAAPEAAVSGVVERLVSIAHTGRPGDGKVFVVPLEAALRIASGERGEAAL
jgi:nitrogen regulatory protein P-II 1